jgi:hypothetical protein
MMSHFLLLPSAVRVLFSIVHFREKPAEFAEAVVLGQESV